MGQVWALERMPVAPSAPRGDCLVLQTAPCAIAIPAARVEQICDDRDWPDAALLPTFETLVGVTSQSGSVAGRRVLVLGGPEGPVGVSIPHGLAVLAASQTQQVPLPDLFGGKDFCGLLLWQGQPKALVIDCDQLRARVLAELLRI
jgi:hypothetical protein